MATISATDATTGFVPKGSVFGIGETTAQTISNNLATVGQIRNFKGLTLSVYHVTAVTDTDTITIGGMNGAVACAWQPEDLGDDGDVSVLVNPAASATGARSRIGTIFTFVGGGGTEQGWLWVLHAD